MRTPLVARTGRWLGIGLVLSMVLLPVPASGAEPTVPTEPTFTFAGGGYGHGTGMSQYGAQGQALEGRSWQTILSTYFSGVDFALLRTNPAPGQIGDEGPLWVGLDQDLTHQEIRIWPIAPNPQAVTVTRGQDRVDVLPGPDNILTFDFTNYGCTFSVATTSWPAGSCRFDIEWDGWSEFPTVALDTTMKDSAPSCDQEGERCYSRGSMKIRPNVAVGDTPSGFHLAMNVDMQDYLYGLLEVPYSWHPQALAAQAVAGRSYAANKQALRGSPEESTLRQELCWCELYDSTVDQVYGGWGRGVPAWLDAVDSTDGIVLYHPTVTAPSFHQRAGQPVAVPTFYSSSTFGHTEDSGVAFGSSFTPSYLVGVPDPWSTLPATGNPLATWEKQITRRELAGMVGLDTVDDAAVVSWLRSGTAYQSAYQVTFTGTKNDQPATVTHLARQLRTPLGLRSMQITGITKFVPDGWVDTGGGSHAPDQVGMQDPLTGKWFIRDANGTVRPGFYYGVPGDIPLACDWNRDGVGTVGLYRPTAGYMYLRNTNDFGVADLSFYFGVPEDVPICGDWNGDGQDSIGIYRPSTRMFHLADANQTAFADYDVALAAPGSLPLAGDWNGDGYDTIGLYDPAGRTVSLTNSLSNPTIAISYAYNTIPEDKIIIGDWNGDGYDTVGVFRPPDLAFYLRDDFIMDHANIDFLFGQARWTPVAGVWNAG